MTNLFGDGLGLDEPTTVDAAPAAPANVFHSKESAEWYTDVREADLARKVMGKIDLDPASCEFANRVVQATRYFTEADNGLVQPWYGNVFVNAPGGLVNEFWNKLMDEYLAHGHIKMAIWLGYNIQQLQTLQNAGHTSHPLHFPICVPDRRLRFYNEKTRIEESQPAHANYFVFMGPLRMYGVFQKYFSELGDVTIPSRPYHVDTSHVELV